MDLDTITKLIANLGFPIFVAVWLLLRSDTILREVRDAIRELSNSLDKAVERTGVK